MTTIEITKRADFYWVNVDEKPCYPCGTEAEAFDLAQAIEGADFILGPVVESTHNGKPTHFRTCYELEDGRWEGFVSMISLDA